MSGARSASESSGAICPKVCAAASRTSAFSSFIALMSVSMSSARSASESSGAICPRARTAASGGPTSLHPSLL